MDKNEYIKDMLLADIMLATTQINICTREIEQIRKLPNSCNGYVFEDAVVCENDDYKLDALECYQHQLGYYTCLKNKSKSMLNLIDMNISEFATYLERQAMIMEQNEKTIENLKNKLKIDDE